MGRPRKGTEPSKEEVLKRARARSARYYAAHTDKAKASAKRWRVNNLEERKIHESAYRKENKERYRAHCIARRTKKTESGGYFTVEEWFTLCFACGFRCLRCHEIKPLTADHVIPISKGGTSWLWNIQPLCLSCNCKKSDKTTDYREDSVWARKYDNLLGNSSALALSNA